MMFLLFHKDCGLKNCIIYEYIGMFDIENNSEPIDILFWRDVAGRLFTGKRRVLSSELVLNIKIDNSFNCIMNF